jgi:geranylgeranyl pyrophosphate synthase
MSQIEQTEDLRTEIRTILTSLAGADSLYRLVEEPLKQMRRGLAEDIPHDYPWSLLPMMVCEAVCNSYEQAVPVAAAIQIFLAAGDVFDDIEDADSLNSLSAKYGFAKATNAGTTLLILAEKAITRLKQKDTSDHIILKIMDEVNSSYISTCIGQHQDLCLSRETIITEDRYFRVMSLKSASQIECACRIGAILANTTQPMIDSFSLFGQNLGMAAQISNDIQGITSGSDILKQKITLPLIFALNQTDKDLRYKLKQTFFNQSESIQNPNEVRDILFHIGAINYAVIKMEYYKQCAFDYLEKARELGARTKQLQVFFK